MKEKNQPVGTSPCPIKGCELITKVFKYRSRSDDPAKRRFAGRLYCECEKHGRVENQEFLLESMKWDEEKKRPVEPSAPVRAPDPKPQTTRANEPQAPAKEPLKHASDPPQAMTKKSWI